MNDQDLNDLTIDIFDNKDSAERAFNEAIRLGYMPEEINVLMSDDSGKKYYSTHFKPELDEHPDEHLDEPTKGLAVGGAVGGAIGGTIGALIALGSNLALPGLGVIIAGPLAGAGSISGGLLGSLIGWSLPKTPSNTYESLLKNGCIILAVKETPGKPSLQDAWQPYRSTNVS